jgi:hypothetical protein
MKFTGVNIDGWQYMFGSAWVYIDNTPKGAAARIRHYVANGLPSNANRQRLGEAPLTYVS